VDGGWCLVDGEKTAVGNGSQPFRRVDERRVTSEKKWMVDGGWCLVKRQIDVGNGSQPFRRVDERRAMNDLPLPPPAGDTSEEVVGRGPRRAAFLFGLFGEQSLHRGTVPTTQTCNVGCRARSPSAPLFSKGGQVSGGNPGRL